MRFVSRLLAVFMLCSVFAVAVPQPASAAWNPFGGVSCGRNGSGGSAVCRDRNQASNPLTGTNGVIMNITNLIAFIAGLIVLIFIILAGLRMVTGAGSSEDIAGARRTLIYCVVGLIVIAFARTLVAFVITRSL